MSMMFALALAALQPEPVASCGARAAFEDMVRVPASDEEMDALLETLRDRQAR